MDDKMVSIQVQSVLYHNELDALYSTAESLCNAVAVAGRRGVRCSCKLCYGDASSSPLLDTLLVEDLRGRCGELADIDYTFFNENTGTAKGHNILAENVDADYLLVMNPDVILSPSFLVNMLKPMKLSDVGIVEARQTPIEHPKDYSVDTGDTPWASTAAALIRSDVFRTVGGFDEDTFFMYCDDVDFSWRVRLSGKRVIYQPSAPVFHAKRLSIEGGWQSTSAERYYSAEAALLLAYKWSNQPLVEKLLELFDNGDENQIKAAEEFRRRCAQGKLPDRLDEDRKIGCFINGNYAKHRYAL